MEEHFVKVTFVVHGRSQESSFESFIVLGENPYAHSSNSTVFGLKVVVRTSDVAVH